MAIADPPVLAEHFQSIVTGQYGCIRLHGAPRVYYSSYGEVFISGLADALLESKAEQIWCVFDNTASGAALRDALDLKDRLQTRSADPGYPHCQVQPCTDIGTNGLQ